MELGCVAKRVEQSVARLGVEAAHDGQLLITSALIHQWQAINHRVKRLEEIYEANSPQGK